MGRRPFAPKLSASAYEMEMEMAGACAGGGMAPTRRPPRQPLHKKD